jgi:hypothetical protein
VASIRGKIRERTDCILAGLPLEMNVENLNQRYASRGSTTRRTRLSVHGFTHKTRGDPNSAPEGALLLRDEVSSLRRLASRVCAVVRWTRIGSNKTRAMPAVLKEARCGPGSSGRGGRPRWNSGIVGVSDAAGSIEQALHDGCVGRGVNVPT